jgi:hypothetical protein
MTWGEFKALVDKGIKDDTPIWHIDVEFPDCLDVLTDTILGVAITKG